MSSFTYAQSSLHVAVNEQQNKNYPGCNRHFNLTISRLDLDEEKGNQIDEGVTLYKNIIVGPIMHETYHNSKNIFQTNTYLYLASHSVDPQFHPCHSWTVQEILPVPPSFGTHPRIGTHSNQRSYNVPTRFVPSL